MDFQKTKLKDLANIDSGFTFRTRIVNDPGGNVFAIQMRDISDLKTGISQTPHKVFIEKLSEKYPLRKGDILFAAKGSNNYAVCYDTEYSPAVAASAFFVIRPDKKKILPEYLCHVINSEIVQNYLRSNLAGTYIPNINKHTLTEMKIPIPPPAVQQKIVMFLRLFQKETELIHAITSKRELIMNELVKNMITGKIHFKDGK
jgi:restriction endonuclease S subunit